VTESKRTDGGALGTSPQDAKPDSDEAHSAFTPPLGVPLPPAPEPEGSAFWAPPPPPRVRAPPPPPRAAPRAPVA
jgi:hypothetical protein